MNNIISSETDESVAGDNEAVAETDGYVETFVYDEQGNKVNLKVNAKKAKSLNTKRRGKNTSIFFIYFLLYFILFHYTSYFGSIPIAGYNVFPYTLYTCYETYCLVLKYDESGKSRASRRYNHVKGFQRKMRELKSTTGDDILVELHQNTSPAIVKRWATNTSLFNKTAPISSASTPIASSASSSASPTLTDIDCSQ